jgi:phage-related protein
MVKEILFFGDDIIDFYQSQETKVRLKIEYVLDLIRFEVRVPDKFFKKLENTDGIYEVRVITSRKSIRLLCFNDDRNLIVLTNGFVKKTQKTPKREIEKAERLKKEYLIWKRDENENT